MSPNKMLRTKPLEFMKQYAVSPPDGAGMSVVDDPAGRLNAEGMPMKTTAPNQTLTPARTVWNDPGGVIKGDQVNSIDFRQVVAGGAVYVDVVDVVRDKPGAKTFDISKVNAGGRVPIHFLPWNSGSLVSMKLPDAGADMDNPENPNIFFTAALSGCSVFVDGHPARPRVVHAGINEKLTMTAKGFWEQRLFDLARLPGQSIDDHLRSVNKGQYSKTPWGPPTGSGSRTPTRTR